MKKNIDGKLAAICMMPWFVLALSYFLSAAMGVKEGQLVKATVVVWAVISPIVMYAMCSALFEAGVRALVKSEREKHVADRG